MPTDNDEAHAALLFACLRLYRIEAALATAMLELCSPSVIIATLAEALVVTAADSAPLNGLPQPRCYRTTHGATERLRTLLRRRGYAV